jgi:Helitron helicase-like domain at N-terminus
MNQCFQDAMAVAQYYHGFDLFITLTLNPNWPKIKNKLLPMQSPADRPNLVVCVFCLYQNSLITNLMDRNIFGNAVAQVHSIEFQKCGLPHMHLLLCLLP